MEKLFDTHTHLDIIGKKMPSTPVDKIWQTAQENNIQYACQIGIDLKSSKDAINLSAKLPGIFFSLGYHPSNKSSANEVESIIQLANQTKDNKNFVAIGETGLDYYWVKDKKARLEQKDYLIKFSNTAVALDKTLIIHARPGNGDDALKDLLLVFKNAEKLPRIILHCFAGDKDYVNQFNSFDCYFSFAGNVTYKNAITLQDSLKAVPPERLLLETDAPYLSPVPKRGKINQPDFLKFTFEFACQLIQSTENKLADTLMDNSLRAFNIQ